MDTAKNATRALAIVFEDLSTALEAIKALGDGGFSDQAIELITKNVRLAAPELSTPGNRETTSTSMIDGIISGAAAGSGVGALASFAAPFPGMALSMIAVGGLTGGIVGGVGGIDHAVMDDSVDLPTIEEYEQLVEQGCCLVVVLGTHEDAMRAEDVLLEMPALHNHTHVLHGHEFHEHPTKQ